MSNPVGVAIGLGVILTPLWLMFARTVENGNDLSSRIRMTEDFACTSVEQWQDENPEESIELGTVIPYHNATRQNGNIVVTSVSGNQGAPTIGYTINYADGGEYSFGTKMNTAAPC